ncbi:MAG: hypothetical protein J6Q17_02230 [Clostridia bacterium]|nr:hypothetical protein [Clostridia bacterium]
MKRIAILLLSALTLLTLLTGCIHEDFGIKLNEDGTGSIAARIGIDKDVYNQALGMGADLYADSEEEPTEYEYKGKTYVSVTETTEYASFDELRQALLDLTYETDELAQLNDLEAAGEPAEEEAEALIAEVTDLTEDAVEAVEDEAETAENSVETAEAAEEEPSAAVDNHIFKEVLIEKKSGLISESYVFSAKMNAVPDDPDAETPLSSAFLVTVSVEMPSEITNASENATVEGNKATFEISDLTVENEFAVESSQTNVQLIIAVVVVLILALAAFLLFTKFHGKEKE